MAVAKSIQIAVVLALYTYPDSHIGEQLPQEVIDMAEEEGLIGKAGPTGRDIYMTDAGRDRMTKVLAALA
jgi:hypothetical protein